MSLNSSAEMYLETIFVLCQEKNTIRSIDIAEHMGYSKPSVSRAVGLLKKDGYITVDEGGHILLTAAGEAYAKKIYERHTVLTNVLILLGVDEKTATEDACRIEHVISDRSFDAIQRYLHG